MCRSSTKSIGFLLLLWIGIFLPVTEQQAPQLADLGSLLSISFGDDEADTDARASADHSNPSTGSSVNADLSDITLVTEPTDLALTVAPLGAQRIAEGFASRALPPQERPPNDAAA